MLNSNSLVSICLATYNGEKYLEEQLDSIVNQSYKNLELIVQDDCSSDNTIEILNRYKDKINITIYQNEKNQGYIKNFESVIKKANGKYISICDQDDIWDKEKIQILLDNIDNNSLIYSNSMLVDENGDSLDKRLSDKLKNNFIDSDTCLNFLFDNCVSAHAMIFKKDLLEKIFPLPINIYFDAWIAATAAINGGVKYIDRDLVFYRQHSSNTLGNVKKDKVAVHSKVLNKVEKKEKVNNDTLEKINELLNINGLKDSEKDILEKLKNYYESFENRWFSINMMNLLFENKDVFFKITTKKPFSLCLKKAIGKKLYQKAPFL